MDIKIRTAQGVPLSRIAADLGIDRKTARRLRETRSRDPQCRQSTEPGDYYFEAVDPADFGRIAALTAKRVIAQRVLEHEREAVFQQYRPLQGTIVRGLVQREIHGSVYVVFEDGHEAVLPRSERAPRTPSRSTTSSTPCCTWSRRRLVARRFFFRDRERPTFARSSASACSRPRGAPAS